MKRNKSILLIILVLFISITFLSVGFSAASATDKIENIMASVKPTAMARITNVITTNSSGMGVSNSENYNMDKIYGTVTLPNADSSITYKVNVTVYLESVMKISEIINESPYLDFELSDYSIGDALCNNNNECNFGATKELYITMKYKEGVYDSSNITYPFELDFVFEELSNVARIGETYYVTLQEAIDDVPTNNQKTTVVLLKNTSELLQIDNGKNIEFDFQNFTISNNGNTNVIINNGTIEIKNGTITSDAGFGAIDNNPTGVLKMSGGSIITTGIRQTIYNNGGTVEISGSAYLKTNATDRSTINNVGNGHITILGGTIISEKKYAVENTNGTLVIGSKDGTVNTNTPVLQGYSYGVSSKSAFGFYDGVIKGIKNSFEDFSKVSDTEDGYGIINDTDYINGNIYVMSYLAQIYEVRFNSNEGTCSEATRNVKKNDKVGVLPVPTRTGYYFDGWFTSLEGGTKINQDTVISDNIEFFAHWTSIEDAKNARIGDIEYKTLQQAINAVPADNSEVTITILHDIAEIITIEKNKNVVLDIQSNTLRNSGVSNVIKNYGTLKIINGTINSSTTQGAINNYKGAYLYINGGSINAIGTKQAVYNDGGIVEISGDAYLTSTTNQRATVQNLNGGTITIKGGTMISKNFSAVDNASTLIIGSKDGNINASTPVMIGRTYGISNTGTLKYYDGISKGVTSSINGNINEFEDNSTRIDSTETIDGLLYNTMYLS